MWTNASGPWPKHILAQQPPVPPSPPCSGRQTFSPAAPPSPPLTSGPNTFLSSSLSRISRGRSSERAEAASKSTLKPSGSSQDASVAVGIWGEDGFGGGAKVDVRSPRGPARRHRWLQGDGGIGGRWFRRRRLVDFETPGVQQDASAGAGEGGCRGNTVGSAGEFRVFNQSLIG